LSTRSTPIGDALHHAVEAAVNLLHAHGEPGAPNRDTDDRGERREQFDVVLVEGATVLTVGDVDDADALALVLDRANDIGRSLIAVIFAVAFCGAETWLTLGENFAGNAAVGRLWLGFCRCVVETCRSGDVERVRFGVFLAPA
jgi:hypothetical protein